MSIKKFGNTFEIGNNCKAWHYKLTSLCKQGSSRIWCTKRYILYEKNVFWTNMTFWVSKAICLLSLNRAYGEKTTIKIA